MPQRWPVPNPWLTFTVVAWAFNFIVFKFIYRDMQAPEMSLLRFFAMLPLVWLTCRALKLKLAYRREDGWKLLFAGFVSGGLYMVLFATGMQTAGPAEGAVAMATVPLLTATFAALSKQEQFTARLGIGSLVAFGGVALVVLGDPDATRGELRGNLIVLSSAVVWSWSVLLMRGVIRGRSPLQAYALAMPGAFFALVPWGARPTLAHDWGAVSLAGWLSFGYMVLVAGLAAHLAFYKGLEQVGPSRATLIQYFIPPTAALFGWLILGDALSLLQIAGMGVVVAGVSYGLRRGSEPG